VTVFTEVTHLIASGPTIPDLTSLKKLIFLGWAFRPKDKGVLTALKTAGPLRGLYLAECEAVPDIKAIRGQVELRNLLLGDLKKLKDLEVLREMTKLDTLVIGDNRLTDISAIVALQDLQRLALLAVPEELKDLTPLMKLKKLKKLVVDNDALKKRKAEFDEIQKALPDCEITGFCMGSWWILPVLGLGLGLGLLWRRRRMRLNAAG
jgi:hypothetical protein